METFALYSLVFHGVIGGLDVLINHELLEHLPRRPTARRELLLHSLRELLYGLLFASLAWGQWHGGASGFIVFLIVAEIAVSTVDSLEEDRSRRLPGFERILHIVLLINVGVYATLLAPVLLAWQQLPTALRLVDHGWPSWLLSGLALLAIAWSVRDGLCCWRWSTKRA